MRWPTFISPLALALVLAVPFAGAKAQSNEAPLADQVAATDPSSLPNLDADATDPGTDAVPGGGTQQQPSSEPAAPIDWPVVRGAPADRANTPSTAAPASPATPAAAPADAKPVFDIGIEVRDRLPKAREGGDMMGERIRAVAAVYAARRDEAIWVTPTGLSAKGAKVIAEIQKAADWGLDVTDYVLPDLSISSNGLSREKLAEAESDITFAVLAYAHDARGGRIMEPSKQLSSYLDRTPQLIEPRVLLEEIADAEDPAELMRKLHPQHAQFEKLRQQYLALRSKAATARDVVQMPSNGPKLMPGIKHPHVALLRERLGLAIEAGSDGEVYDAALETAVRAYQEKNGQKPDGIVGRNTRAALNDITVPDPKRLIANMEQWRWMPADLGETYITVNIPEFMVRIYHKGQLALEERVVVGELTKQTPVFSDELETIYFHPRWNVPESIKVLELYPSLTRGGGSFRKQGLVLARNGKEIDPSSVDWSQADIRNFEVYQPSGERNVLGLVKFVFPNKHGVYLHDTSAKALFDEPSRPFSHGCMRVRNPLKVAEALLAIDKQWQPSQVTDILDREPDETPVLLDRKIPVHVTYFTSRVDDDGNELTFKDVYGHEERVKLALAGKFSQIAVGVDHLAPVKFNRVQYAQSPDDFGSFFGFGQSSNSYQSNGSSNSDSGSESLADFFDNVFGGGYQAPPAKAKRKTGTSHKTPN